jgi:hypothetical protein
VLLDKREEAELEQQSLQEHQALPKTVEGFKRSRVYLLERHISRYRSKRLSIMWMHASFYRLTCSVANTHLDHSARRIIYLACNRLSSVTMTVTLIHLSSTFVDCDRHTHERT